MPGGQSHRYIARQSIFRIIRCLPRAKSGVRSGASAISGARPSADLLPPQPVQEPDISLDARLIVEGISDIARQALPYLAERRTASPLRAPPRSPAHPPSSFP